jgi:16S rRNA processing protein RimM
VKPVNQASAAVHASPTHEVSRWVAIARLLRPQGRRGELLADPLTDLPEIFTPGLEVAFALAGVTSPLPAEPTVRLEQAWPPTGKNAGRIVLKLSGCDTISQAEALAGRDLLIRAANLPALEPGAFFVAELLGCELYNGSVLAGTIVDVQFPTSPDGRTRLEDAAPLLAIQPARAAHLHLNQPAPPPHDLQSGPESGSEATPESAPEPVLVPFVRAWLESVDLPARRIVMTLPPGLLGNDEA